jgi:spoIIIJ-associated protein
MEWVETTGKTVDEALERALSHLGVGKDDAEVEIVEEPRSGLFGRVRGEARVRARVRPAGPRPKRGRRPGERSAERSSRGRSPANRPEHSAELAPGVAQRSRGGRGRGRGSSTSTESPATTNKVSNPTRDGTKARQEKEKSMAEGISLAEQGTLAKDFLVGLLEAMGIEATVSVREIDEETVELAIDAEPPTELGILVGPRGTTLQSLQEVTRTVVQSKAEGRTDRILVDVARYRERRVAALARFAQQVAGEVIETGEERALEAMSPADRKAIHDALADDERVTTRSEGEEPRRFVVIAPA